MSLSVATVFLEAERDRLILLAEGNWGPRSTLLGDLPPSINVLRVPRPVNTDALIFPLRHAAPRLPISFPADISTPLCVEEWRIEECGIEEYRVVSTVYSIFLNSFIPIQCKVVRTEAHQAINMHP